MSKVKTQLLDVSTDEVEETNPNYLESRCLKISTRYRNRSGYYDRYGGGYSVPELRLNGIWLAAAGFISESYVEVEVSKNQLIIHLKESPLEI